jgi:hypothetical protein
VRNEHCRKVAACLVRRPLRTNKPKTVGLSSQRLERVGIDVQRSSDDKPIAGVPKLFVRREQIAWFKEQGSEDREVGKAA